MTPIQRIAQIYGVVFTLAGVVGFLTTEFSLQMSMLLGLFPVNLVHNAVHLLFGVWGLRSARTVSGAVGYCRGAGLVYVVLAVLGIVAANVLVPIVPIHGNDVWLHALLGFSLIGFGLGMSPEKSNP